MPSNVISLTLRLSNHISVCISACIIRVARNDEFMQLALMYCSRHFLEKKLNKDTGWADRNFMKISSDFFQK
jgi:hypothetical protein